jgi:hypothetical protein
MVFVAPRTWTDDEVVTEGMFNANIRDTLAESIAGKVTANGDLAIGTGLGAMTRLAAGAENSPLRVAEGASPLPAWWLPTTFVPIYGPYNFEANSTSSGSGHYRIVKMYSGPLLRVRLDPNGSIHFQKITDPTDWSAWAGSWTALSNVTSDPYTIGVASDTDRDMVNIYMVENATEKVIRRYYSTDAVTWNNEVVYTEGGSNIIRALASDSRPTGLGRTVDAWVIYLLDTQSGDPDVSATYIERDGSATWVNRTQHGAQRYPAPAGFDARRDPATDVIYMMKTGSQHPIGQHGVEALDFTLSSLTFGSWTSVVTPIGSTYRMRSALRLSDADYGYHLYQYVEAPGAVPPYNWMIAVADPANRYTPIQTITHTLPDEEQGFQLLRHSSGWYMSSRQRAFWAPLAVGPLAALTEDYTLPWLIPIDTLDPPTGQTNWSTRASINGPYTSVLSSSGAQNDEIYWDIPLHAGRWRLGVVYQANTDAGIMTVTFDATTIVTIDTYSASSTLGNVSTTSNIRVAADGIVRLKVKMATKNASASAYKGYLHHISLMRVQEVG